MAHFRGTIQGNRGEASRLGSISSGLSVACNGWDSGVSVEARYNKENKVNVFSIFATGGSGYGRGEGYIGKVVDGKFYPAKS